MTPRYPTSQSGQSQVGQGGFVRFNILAQSVHLLMMPPPPDVTEDSERVHLIWFATAACKAGADYILVVKPCLYHASSQQQFIIKVLTMSEFNPALVTLVKFPSNPALNFPILSQGMMKIDIVPT